MSKWFHPIALVLIFTAGLIIFHPIFSMSLYGDEWQMLWFAKSISLNQYQIQPDDIWNAYWIEMITFDFLSRWFGYNGFYFYLLSFLCRFISVGVFYWFLLRRSISKKIAFLASILFMVTPIGIEATDWARNFDSYLGIAIILVIADRVWILSKMLDVLICIILSLSLFLINPLRSHGNLQVIFLLLIVRSFQIKSAKYPMLTLLIISAVYYLFVNIGIFGGLPNFSINSQNIDLRQLLESLIGNIGRSYIPSFGNESLIFLIVAAMGISWKIKLLTQKSYLNRGLLILSLVFICYVLIKSLAGNIVFSTSIYYGLYFVLFFISILILEIINKSWSEIIKTIFVLSMSTAHIIFPAIRQPDFRASSDHRYLIYASLAVPIMTSYFLQNLGQVKYKRVIGLFLVLVLIFTFSIFSYKFLKSKSISHNATYSDHIWSQIRSAIPSVDTSRKISFIFLKNTETDTATFGDSVAFGFMFHAGLIYNIWNINNLPYMFVESDENIQSLLTDGKAARRYFNKEMVLNKNDTYLLELKDNEIEVLDVNKLNTKKHEN